MSLRGFVLFLLLLPAMPKAAPLELDRDLRLRLAVAMAEDGAAEDRFEAEVWLTDMSTRLAKRLPDSHERLGILRQAFLEARRADLAPELVLAVIQVESNFDRFAISSAGAQGLMQVMPFWLKEIGHAEDNLFHVHTNLRMGCTILRYYLDMERGDLSRALARYNGSLGSAKYPQLVYRALRNRWYQ
jgi:soluble lytic murein transglycosylase-like protein